MIWGHFAIVRNGRVLLAGSRRDSETDWNDYVVICWHVMCCYGWRSSEARAGTWEPAESHGRQTRYPAHGSDAQRWTDAGDRHLAGVEAAGGRDADPTRTDGRAGMLPVRAASVRG